MYRFLIVFLLLPISLVAKPSANVDVADDKCPGKLLKMSTVKDYVSSIEFCTKPGKSIEFYRIVNGKARVIEELSPIVCGVDQARFNNDIIVERTKDAPVKVLFTTDGLHSISKFGEHNAQHISDEAPFNASRCFIPTQFCEFGQLMTMPRLRGEEYMVQLCTTPGVTYEEYFVEVAEPGVAVPKPRTRIEHVFCEEKSVKWIKGDEVVQYSRDPWHPIVIRAVSNGEHVLFFDHDKLTEPPKSIDHHFVCYTRRLYVTRAMLPTRAKQTVLV